MSTSTPKPTPEAPERAPLVDLNEALRAAPQRKGRFGAPEAAAVLLVGALIVVTVAEAEQSPYDEALLALAEAPFEPSAAPTDARSAKVRHLYRMMLRHEVEPDGLSLLTGERSAQDVRVRAMLVDLARADRDGPDTPTSAPALVASNTKPVDDAPSVRALPGALPSASDTIAKARARAAEETGAAPAATAPAGDAQERYKPVTGVIAEPLATREVDDVTKPLTEAERAAMADLTLEELHRTSPDADGKHEGEGHTHAYERAEALQANNAKDEGEGEGDAADNPADAKDDQAEAKADEAAAKTEAEAPKDDAKPEDDAASAKAVAVPDLPFEVVPADALPEELRGKLHVPLLKGRVLQAFGEAPSKGSRTRVRHTGWTIRAPKGHRIRCAGDGKVVFSGIYKGYGRMVIVDHGNGLHTIYSNLKSFLAIKGMDIKRGQPLGTIGIRSGAMPVGELYFELRQNGKPIDPEGWFTDPTKEEGY